MSKNTNLSFLTDYITADITNGRIGINTPSPTVAFDVTGAGKFSSSVTSDDLILTAGTLFGTGNTGFSNRLSDTTLYLQMPATGFNITDNALNTKFILSSAGVATFSGNVNIAVADPRLIIKKTSNSQESDIIFQENNNGHWILSDNSTTNDFSLYNYNTASNNLFVKYSNGNVGIGTSSPTWQLEVYKDSSSGSLGQYPAVSINNPNATGYSAFLLYKGATVKASMEYGNASDRFDIGSVSDMTFITNSAFRMRITNGGLVYIYSLISTYTTAQGANMYVNPADGAISRSTSSIKYKTDVLNYDKGLETVNQLRPVYYKGINDGDKIFAGLIAEEVHDLGLTEFVQYAENGTPDALSYQNMVALAFKAIQELSAEITILKNK